MDVEVEIKEFIANNFMKGESAKNLKNDSSFLDMGIIDSMGLLELMAFIEETYSIEIADEELIPDNFDSVNKLATYIKKKATA